MVKIGTKRAAGAMPQAAKRIACEGYLHMQGMNHGTSSWKYGTLVVSIPLHRVASLPGCPLQTLSAVGTHRCLDNRKHYFIFYSDGKLIYYKSKPKVQGKDAPHGAVFLNGDFYVADCLLRKHAFQMSDFNQVCFRKGSSYVPHLPRL